MEVLGNPGSEVHLADKESLGDRNFRGKVWQLQHISFVINNLQEEGTRREGARVPTDTPGHRPESELHLQPCPAHLTVSPILSPTQDLRPGMTSLLRQVALKDRDNSSGRSRTSSSTLERIFWAEKNKRKQGNEMKEMGKSQFHPKQNLPGGLELTLAVSDAEVSLAATRASWEPFSWSISCPGSSSLFLSPLVSRWTWVKSKPATPSHSPQRHAIEKCQNVSSWVVALFYLIFFSSAGDWIHSLSHARQVITSEFYIPRLFLMLLKLRCLLSLGHRY